jgi:hypothetical protein
VATSAFGFSILKAANCCQTPHKLLYTARYAHWARPQLCKETPCGVRCADSDLDITAALVPAFSPGGVHDPARMGRATVRPRGPKS